MLTVNGIQITPTIFSDNTSQIWKLPEELLKAEKFHIVWGYTHEGEFLRLAQLHDIYYGYAL